MIRKIFNIFFIFIIFVSVCDAASKAYLERDDVVAMQGLDEFIKQRDGNITWSGDALKYNIEVNGRQAVIDFSTDKSVKSTMSALFPDTIFIKFIFLRVFPDADIVIEKRKYGITDKFGNFNRGGFFDTQPGLHHVQLLRNTKVVAEAEVSVVNENDINCFVKTKMQCKQLSS